MVFCYVLLLLSVLQSVQSHGLQTSKFSLSHACVSLIFSFIDKSRDCGSLSYPSLVTQNKRIIQRQFLWNHCCVHVSFIISLRHALFLKLIVTSLNSIHFFFVFFLPNCSSAICWKIATVMPSCCATAVTDACWTFCQKVSEFWFLCLG